MSEAVVETLENKEKRDSSAGVLTTILVSIVIFSGAGLLFVIQPFTARLFLPLAGGSPSLWNACMVFFQSLLLLGYTLTHLTTSHLKLRGQIVFTSILLMLPFMFLPVVSPDKGPPPDSDPTLWFLVALATTVGVPFLLLSMAAPLLQKWLSQTRLPVGKDPYFLYAASNAGSLIGLLGYPLVVEPFLSLTAQGNWFTWGYGFFSAGIISSGALCYFYRADSAQSEVDSSNPPEPQTLSEEPPRKSIPLRRALYWVLLAFIPSSMSLGVTHHLSTEIASIPLLWALPLSVYLLTYIMAFSQRFRIETAKLSKAVPVVVGIIAFAFLRHSNEPILLIVGLHLSVLFISGLLCHGLLSETRPDTANLTLFYLLLAVGGSLGGVFNALIAPFIFGSILEYPLIIALVCWIRTDEYPSQGNWKRNLAWAGPAAVMLWMLGVRYLLGDRDSFDIGQLLLRDLIPPVAVWFMMSSRAGFALSTLVILMISNFFPSAHGTVIYTQRTFFGVHRVTISPDERFVQLIHGTTIHGLQNRDPDKRMLPTSYFHPSGPIGQMFRAVREARALADDRIREVGIIGLGAGSIAAYGEQSERFTYFEIDLAVIEIAENPALFTYLKDSAAQIRNVLGDGRKTLEIEPDGLFDILIMDAFSSDSAPIHLLTREAFELYLRKMKPHGVLALNVSNRYLTMERVVAATLSDLGLVVLHQEDGDVSDEQRLEGKEISFWIVAGRDETSLGRLMRDPYWTRMKPSPSDPRWTDERATLLDMLFK